MERVQLGPGKPVDLVPAESEQQPGEAAAPRRGASFREQLVRVHEARRQARLDELLSDIETQGSRLAASFSLKDLHRYKDLVRSFLREVLEQGFQVRKETDWDHQTWEQRTLVTVRSVNAELAALTADVLSKEQDRLQVLSRLGEIKGLLIDLRV